MVRFVLRAFSTLLGYGFYMKSFFLALQRLMEPLSSLGISFVPITSPPALSSTFYDSIMPASIGTLPPIVTSIALVRIENLICCSPQFMIEKGGHRNGWKQKIEENHREECLRAMDKIMSSHFRRNGCFIIINFFALVRFCIIRCSIHSYYQCHYCWDG